MPRKPAASQDHRQQIRLPADLAEFLKQRAEENSRSFNSEVAHRLKQSRAQEQTEATK